MEAIAIPNDYLMLIFRFTEDHDYLLISPWFFRKHHLLLEKWKLGFNMAKAEIIIPPYGSSSCIFPLNFCNKGLLKV